MTEHLTLRPSPRLSILSLVGLLACGNPGASPPNPDGGVTAPDGAAPDGAIPPLDAGADPDAPSPDPDAGGPDPLLPIARSHDGGHPAAIALGDGLAYAGIGPRLTIFDVADPMTPIVAATRSTGVCAGCASIATDSERLGIADAFAGATGAIRAATLSDLGAVGSQREQAAVFESIALGDDVAYVADWAMGLRVYDLSTPAQPQAIAQLATGGYPSSVALVGDRLYFGESTNGGVLRVFDIGNPASPTELGAAATSKVRDLAVQDGLVYVADEGLFLSAALRIIDASIPSQLEIIGAYEDCGGPVGVAVSGTVALLACSYDGFHIVDVSNPTAPTAIATWSLPVGSDANAVAISGTRAYLGYAGGVIVLDLSVPSAPVELATLPTASRVKDLVIPAPGRLVAATGNGGIYQWDI